MQEVTGGEVRSVTSVAAIKTWCETRGRPIESLAKEPLQRLLEDPNLPPSIRTPLLIRQEAAKSSVAKLEAMISSCSGRQESYPKWSLSRCRRCSREGEGMAQNEQNLSINKGRSQKRAAARR
jgi:hypothetical protein